MYKYFKDKYGKLRFQTKQIDERGNYLLEVLEHNDLISGKHKRVFRPLNYTKHFIVFISAVSGYVSISAFASLVSVPVGIASSAVGIKICAITHSHEKRKDILEGSLD